VVVLGIADGLQAGAALVIDDAIVATELQERHDRTRRSRAFPWAAIGAVLEEAGLHNQDVDQVAIAGQYTPPLFVRQHPRLRRVTNDAFSPAIDAGVFFQALLRGTGIGAAEADRAAEHFEGVLRAEGFAPQRVVTVDIHRALAEAAYRTQPRAECLVLTLHPMGDGSAAAVHRGTDGQLEKIWNQQGFEALHVHLRRCAAAIGFDPHLDDARMWAIAARGTPDATLVERLRGELFCEGGRLSRRSYPLPEGRSSPVYRALGQVDREVAAASVLANLIEAVRSLARWHVRANGARHLALAGSVFENPRLCAAIAELDELESVWVPAAPGYAALPAGAAASIGGIAPRTVNFPGLGRQYGERQYERALAVAGLTAVKPADEAEVAAAAIAEGLAVARFQGRAGDGDHGGGTRTAFVSADDPAAVERLRTALDRPADEEPIALWIETPADGEVHRLEAIGAAARGGAVAVQVDAVFADRYPGVVLADGRVRLQRVDPDVDPALHRLIAALYRRSGCAALAGFALGQGADPPVVVPGDAIRLWQRSGVAGLLFGPFWVRARAVG
jgi:carbamoyltransferase